MGKFFSYLLTLVLLATAVCAGSEKMYTDPVFYVKICVLLLVVLSAYVLIVKNMGKMHKRIVFGIITIPVLLATLYLGGHTVYKNIHSETGGPIHWHADYQIWSCGERLDLIDPKFPRNKIGSPLFHEHNDDRIHIEGTVDKLANIDLGSYFDVIGGKLTTSELIYPSTEGVVSVKNGDQCPDGSVGTLKVYVNGVLQENWEEYVIYPHALVPPGDCFIVQFDSSNEPSTSYICESWNTKGWSYDSYDREDETVGDHSWQ